MVAQHASVQVIDVGDELVLIVYASLRTVRVKGVFIHQVFAARSQEYRQEAGPNTSIVWGRSTRGVCDESRQGIRHHFAHAMLMNLFAGVERWLDYGQAI